MPRISIQDQPNCRSGVGRKAGSHNLFTMETKKLMAEIVAGEMENVKETLNVVRSRKPDKYISLVLKIAEFVVPKTQQVELTTPESIDVTATLEDMRSKILDKE